MISAERPITVEDLRRKAVHIKDMTTSEVRRLGKEQGTQVVVVGVAVVFAAVALAYYMGKRTSRR